MKTKRGRTLKIDFKDQTNIFLNQKRKRIFLLITVAREQIAEDYIKLQKTTRKSNVRIRQDNLLPPNPLLSLLSCDCKQCIENKCACMVNGIKYENMCP